MRTTTGPPLELMVVHGVVDVVFVALTLGVFGLLALAARGIERMTR